MATYAQMRRPFGPIPKDPLTAPDWWLPRCRIFHQHFCCPHIEASAPLPEGTVVPNYTEAFDLVFAVLQRADWWRLGTRGSSYRGAEYVCEVHDKHLPACVEHSIVCPLGAYGYTPALAVFECLWLAAGLDEFTSPDRKHPNVDIASS